MIWHNTHTHTKTSRSLTLNPLLLSELAVFSRVGGVCWLLCCPYPPHPLRPYFFFFYFTKTAQTKKTKKRGSFVTFCLCVGFGLMVERRTAEGGFCASACRKGKCHPTLYKKQTHPTSQDLCFLHPKTKNKTSKWSWAIPATVDSSSEDVRAPGFWPSRYGQTFPLFYPFFKHTTQQGGNSSFSLGWEPEPVRAPPAAAAPAPQMQQQQQQPPVQQQQYQQQQQQQQFAAPPAPQEKENRPMSSNAPHTGSGKNYTSSNAWASNVSQNSGNMLSERSSTRIHQPPGGASSISF